MGHYDDCYAYDEEQKEKKKAKEVNWGKCGCGAERTSYQAMGDICVSCPNCSTHKQGIHDNLDRLVEHVTKEVKYIRYLLEFMK